MHIGRWENALENAEENGLSMAHWRQEILRTVLHQCWLEVSCLLEGYKALSNGALVLNPSKSHKQVRANRANTAGAPNAACHGPACRS